MSFESDLARRKAELRMRARAARCDLDPATCEVHALKAATHLLSLEELTSARTVLAYAASVEELDPSPAVSELRRRGARIVLPRIRTVGVLDLHVYEEGDVLETATFGIGQPAEDSPTVRPDEIDAVIVPGVAFDESGRRLGYGGGYYDRLLPLLRPAALRVGLAYDEQIVEALPTAEHDAHVHAVVTPSRVIRISAG